jgi:integrase
VRAKLKEMHDRLEAGAPIKDATMTLTAWLDDWMAKALPASDRKQATIDLYERIARTHLAPTLGGRTLDRIRPSDVEALIVTKREQGLSPSTVRTIYTVLRGALDVAVRDGLLRRNPAAVVKRPAVERQDAAYLTADDAHRLLEAIRGDRLEALFRLMLATGLRRGEALGLHWSDVDLDMGALRVRWTLTRTSKGLQLGEPKTEKSRRAVPLPRSAVDVLRAHQTRQAADRDAAHEVWRDSGLVFTTEIGTPLEPRNVLRRFELLAQRAGLPRCPPAHAAALHGQLPARRRHPHLGRPGTPRPFVLPNHRGHLQPRRARAETRIRRRAGRSAELVTLLYADRVAEPVAVLSREAGRAFRPTRL